MMKVRFFTVLLAGVLAACGQGGPSARPEPESAIACALAGAEGFARNCTVEPSRAEGRDILIVHHPDGGFRRFVLGADGTLATADGAVEAGVAENGALLDVRVGDDRYRFPYPLRHDAPRP